MPGKRVTIQVDAITAALEATLTAMTPKRGGTPRKTLTPEQERLLLKHRARGLTWVQLAPVFDVCDDTLRRIYAELTSSPPASSSARASARRSDKSR
jgi:hypothetical protein